MSININLEDALREYCITQDSYLFEDQIYKPLCYLAASILTRYNVRTNLEELVQDMVSTAAIKLPLYYNPSKGKAKSSAYILMSQYFIGLERYRSQTKRDHNKTIFLEDTENDQSSVIVVEWDEVELMKNNLLESEDLFKNLESKLHRRVAMKIIDCIRNPNDYKYTKNSYIKDIAKKSKTSLSVVYTTIKEMRQLVSV